MLRGLLLIALAAVSWGTTGSVTTILVARAAASPLLIGAVRMWLAALLLVVAARVLTGSISVARRDLRRTIAMGGCMATFQAAYFTAVPLTGIAVAALIAICSAPLAITVLAVLRLGERLSPRVGVSPGLGIAGTALLIAGPGLTARLSAAFLIGALLALLAGAAYALYVVIAKASLMTTKPLPLAAGTFTAAACFLTPTLVVLDHPARQIALGWPWLLYLGVVTTAGAYGLYTIGLRHVPASVAGIATLLEPLTATMLGVLVFGEQLGPGGAVGAALLLGGIGLLLTSPSA